MDVSVQLLDAQAPGTYANLTGLDEPQRCFPQHFLEATFAKIGGRVVRLEADGQRCFALLFPRALIDGSRHFTARVSAIKSALRDNVAAALADLLAPDNVHAYWPPVAPGFSTAAQRYGDFMIGAPLAAEVATVRALQAQIWQTDTLYPDDVHSPIFAPATSLVARYEGQLVAFLLGFYRFGSSALPGDTPDRLSIESQVMGIAPAFRRHGLAAALKRVQARQALAAGIELIHWTADPLQFANAALNFATLRAVAGEFLPDFYRMSNALNRVSASRLSISWLLRSARARAGLGDERRATPTLDSFPNVHVLNDGPQLREVNSTGATWLAIETPIDWTALQREDLALAERWRAGTDALLTKLLGYRPGCYVVCDAASDGMRRFLVARAYGDDLIV
jgi:predicted GNAT superfamily acetyltransferase